MEEVNNIIVFRQFDSAIEASIVKTKLDAYGIPCFLTEENLANLYPGQQFMPFQVRLHLFEKDQDQAEQILREPQLSVHDEQLHCPRCRSLHLQRDFPQEASEQFLPGLKLLFFGIFFPKKKVYRCQDCGTEF